MKYRTLKVRKGHRDYTLKKRPYSGNPITPLLLLKGGCLKQAGLTIDTPVSVSVEDGRLLIVRDTNRAGTLLNFGREAKTTTCRPLKHGTPSPDALHY